MPTGPMPPSRLLLAAACLAAACAGPAASAQVLGRTEGRETSAVGYYLYALPNEPTVRVSVQGDVVRTGVYDLGRGYSLASVLAIAGAPEAVTEQDPRDPRVRVRVRRAGSAEVAFESGYRALADGEASAPPLADGDVVTVETLFERGVYVWGAVREPGYFEVGPDVDAVRLLALAGGPQGDGARAQDVVTDATVALIRPGAGIVYQATLESFVTGTDVPALADGDALQVEVVQRDRFTFRDGLSVAGSIAAITFGVLSVVVSLTRPSN